MEEVAGTDKFEVNFLTNGSLSKSLNDRASGYIFINFAENIDGNRKSVELTHHDHLITKLYDELLSKNQQLVVIYTGKRCGHQSRYIRELSESNSHDVEKNDNHKKKNISGIFWQRDQFLLFYTEFHLIDEFRNESMFFDEVGAVDLGTNKFGTKVNVSMNVTESEDYLVFIMTGKNGYWWVDEATWNYEQLIFYRNISAVQNFSFHCTPSTVLATVNRTVVINWKGLQLQPNFNSTKGKPLFAFGDAWDCVYFFTPGILGGLFVACVLLGILFIGILCIMDINTCDRFENTQKKISFVVSE